MRRESRSDTRVPYDLAVDPNTARRVLRLDPLLTQATWRIAEAGEPVDVVFGHDAYEYGWISQVACMS